MAAYAALLRGVNVGGHAPLDMAGLRDALVSLGYRQVSTYRASGNAVFSCLAGAAEVERALEAALADYAGRAIDVLVRSAGDLERVAGGWPFAPGAPAASRHVVFLREPADRMLPVLAQVAGEQALIDGREIYLHLPEGLGRSKLAATVQRQLSGSVATTRNWNTVTALARMTRTSPDAPFSSSPADLSSR